LLSGFAVALLLLCALFGMSANSWAQSTAAPAGAVIGNQATATYTDAANVTRTATSNVVVTTVQQVPDVDLVDNRNQQAGPGSPVYFPHTVTNTGNGDDSFTLAVTDTGGDNYNITPVIYADANSDGVPDNNIPITTTGTLPPGGTFNFVVAGVVPASATAGQTGVVTVTATSTTNGAVTDSNTDTATVTNNAAITVVKSISDNTGPSPSGPYTYTLTYTNNGAGTATALTLTDLIPTGMTYVNGSGRWSVSGNTVLTETNGVADDVAGINYSFAANTVTAIVATVPAGTSGRVTFDVTVNAGVQPSTIPNEADFTYNDGVTPRTGTSNTNIFTVTGNNALTFDGPPAPTPNVPQGATVDFNNVLTNTGSSVDSFDVVVNSPGSFPAGTSFQLLKVGGAVLLDTNGNGIPDTGPVDPNGTFTVVLRAILPPNVATGGPFSVTKTATSFGDPTQSDTATDTLSGITASSVDITNTPNPAGLGAGAGPEVAPVLTVSGNPGTTVTIELDVQNTGPTPDTYLVQYSNTSSFSAPVPLPAGWSVVIRDASNTVVSNTGTLAPGATRTLFADITIPAGQAPGDTEVFFRAVSPTTGSNDIIHDRVTTNTVRAISVEPNNSGQVFAGNSIVYQHTITNNGNNTETNVAVTVGNTAPGFTSVVYPDTNNNGVLDPAEIATPITNIASLAPGASVPVFVKVFAPAGATLGTSDVATLTAAVAGGPSDTATDTTIVITGDVRLIKEQAIDPDGDGPLPLGAFTTTVQAAPPGAIIRYRITAENTGAGPVTNVIVNDTTPSYTVYDNGNGTNDALGNAVWTIDGITFTPGSPVPSDGAAGVLVFSVGTLNPAQSAIVTFGVRIRD
jgi:uncharacterized repeat protein (TIGR01451 family)